MLIDTVSYDSWPSSTWRRIIDEQLGEYRNLTQQAFNALLTRQLAMTVENEPMSDEQLAAYLAPHQSVLGRASFFEHQVRHYDSTCTEEISDALTMPVRLLWGADDRWQPLSYAQWLRADIPDAGLVVVRERRTLRHGRRPGTRRPRDQRLPHRGRDLNVVARSGIGRSRVARPADRGSRRAWGSAADVAPNSPEVID